jgi:succinoglycan biosynthesis protein ExoA
MEPGLVTRSNRTVSDQSPFLSVLLAIRNETSLLDGSLAAIAAQDYPRERMEVIIADGNSVDGSRAKVEAFAGSAPFPVTIVSNPKRSAAAGFNAGLSLARGAVIVILGARALPAPTFLSQSVLVLHESGADAVGGVVHALAEGTEAQAVALALGSPFGVGDARYRYSHFAGDVDTVNYGAYRRAVFEQAGGFDETMQNVEDDEFNYRLRAAGRRLYLSPTIRCAYVSRPSIVSLASQYGRYGYPKVRVLRRYPSQMRPRQFVPAGMVAALLLCLTGYHRVALARRLFWLVAGAYTCANVLTSLTLAKRAGMRYLLLLPAAFAGMHFGYGAASLAGVLRFLLWPLLRGLPEPSVVPPFAPGPAFQQDGPS